MIDDRELLTNTSKWQYHVCGVKKRKAGGGFPDCGTISKAEVMVNQGINIYDIGAYEVGYLPGGDGIIIAQMTLMQAPVLFKYPTIEALIDDGWVVD